LKRIAEVGTLKMCKSSKELHSIASPVGVFYGRMTSLLKHHKMLFGINTLNLPLQRVPRPKQLADNDILS
jgi:hypothetical protein